MWGDRASDEARHVDACVESWQWWGAALDADGEPSAPAKVILRGLDLPEGAAEKIRLSAEARVLDLPRARRAANDEVNLAVRQAIRGELKAFSTQRPAIDVEIVRLPAANAVSYGARRGVH